MKDNISEQLELLEMMKQGFGKVRTEEEIQDDLDKEFQERMERERKQAEDERLFKERLEKEQEEQRQRNYQAHQDIYNFMKVFNELEVDDYYAIIELNNGEQYFAKPNELKRDENYLMVYIMRNVGANSIFENPYEKILETNANQINGIQLKEEVKQEVVIIKKSKFGVMTE